MTELAADTLVRLARVDHMLALRASVGVCRTAYEYIGRTDTKIDGALTWLDSWSSERIYDWDETKFGFEVRRASGKDWDTALISGLYPPNHLYVAVASALAARFVPHSETNFRAVARYTLNAIGEETPRSAVSMSLEDFGRGWAMGPDDLPPTDGSIDFDIHQVRRRITSHHITRRDDTTQLVALDYVRQHVEATHITVGEVFTAKYWVNAMELLWDFPVIREIAERVALASEDHRDMVQDILRSGGS